MNNSEKKTQAICILGMHRSGTSTIARAINLMGAYLGEEADLMRAGLENPEGFWERNDIVNFHDRLLNQLKKTWDTPAPLPITWHRSNEIRVFREELINLVERQFSGCRLWAWKDPRTSILLPLWKDVLEELDINVSCIFVVRNPLDVARSLHKRNGFSYDKSLGIWFNYNINALQASSNTTRFFLSFDSIFKDWETELRKCSVLLKLPWPDDEELFKNNMNSFIRPYLRHSVSTVQDLKDQEVPFPVVELYEILEEITGSNLYRDSEIRLEKLFRDFSSYARFFQSDLMQLLDRYYMIVEKDRQIVEKDRQIVETKHLIQSIINSRSYRLTAPLRKIWSLFS